MIDVSQSGHYVGDCRALLRELPDACVQTIVTSVPYWGLRDYGHPAEIGHEETHLDYVRTIVEVFTQALRVVRDDGTLFLNIGDARAGSWGAQSRPGYTDNGKSTLTGSSMISKRQIASHPRRTGTGSLKRTPGSKRKELLGLPWRIAFGLSDAGWYIRNDCIWAKTNAMPSPVKDRFIDAHEYVFMFSKSETSYFDGSAIAEPAVSTKPAGNGFKRRNRIGVANPDGTPRGQDEPWDGVGGTRSPRTVWIIPTRGHRNVEHVAVMTEEVAERCILAGAPPGGVVLDPFFGSGTTGMVAEKHGRRWIGFDLNPEYEKLQRERTAQRSLMLGGGER